MAKFNPGAPSKYYSEDREKFLKKDFPGFEVCLEMMRKHDPQMQEDGFFTLIEHASEFLEELIAEFSKPENHSLRFWLLELIGRAKSPTAVPFLAEQLYSSESKLRTGAIQALKDLDRKEARTILWQAKSIKFDSEEETAEFQADLVKILDKKL